MIAFLLPNEGSSEDFMDFAVSVDSLERFTGYNFFATAPGQDAIEWYEGQFRPELWK